MVKHMGYIRVLAGPYIKCRIIRVVGLTVFHCSKLAQPQAEEIIHYCKHRRKNMHIKVAKEIINIHAKPGNIKVIEFIPNIFKY